MPCLVHSIVRHSWTVIEKQVPKVAEPTVDRFLDDYIYTGLDTSGSQQATEK